MTPTDKIIWSNEKETVKKNFQSFDYIEIKEVWNIYDKIISVYEWKWFFMKRDLLKDEFWSFLKNIFQKRGILRDNISAVKYQQNKFFLKTLNWEEIIIEHKELTNFLLAHLLKTEKKQDIEKRVSNLNQAIETIFDENNYLINWEIDNKDILKTSKFWVDLDGKNLWDLKQKLDIENKKLFRIYDITWETYKKQELLKKEIKFYTWIWDDYEWWAFYFKMTTDEINSKIQELWKTMTTDEIFEFIKKLNNDIDNNFRRSDMVEQINLKLISWFYFYTFDRLKKENAPNKDFIDFIKLITWRWNLKLDNKEIYNKKQEFSYEDINVDENFKEYSIANKALIYVMYKKWWLLEEISSKKEIKIEDKELEWKTPWDILKEAKIVFDKANPKQANFWQTMLNSLWYTNTLNKPYSKLSFEEKINIWSLARILKELKNLKPEDIKNLWILKELAQKVVHNAFYDLNESFSSNFNETLLDWDWTNAKDLWLTWTSAEIFWLYQDINWNNWLIDWKDENELWLWSIAFWITLVAWLFILWPLLWAWVGAFTFWSWLVAWAKIWAIWWVTSQLLSHKWYDIYREWFVDVGIKTSIEIIISALFTASWLRLLKKAWLGFDPDLFFWKSAYWKAWFTDKWFIVTESLFTSSLNTIVDNMIKDEYIEHHEDSNKSKKSTSNIVPKTNITPT